MFNGAIGGLLIILMVLGGIFLLFSTIYIIFAIIRRYIVYRKQKQYYNLQYVQFDNNNKILIK